MRRGTPSSVQQVTNLIEALPGSWPSTASARRAAILDSEMVMFEWLEKAETPEFKDLISLLK
jgi:hypothetical protein